LHEANSLTYQESTRCSDFGSYCGNSNNRQVEPKMSFVKEGRAKAFAITTCMPPANTPLEIVTKLARALNQTLELPVVKEKFDLQGASADATSSPEIFAKFGQADRIRWASIVKESGVEMEQKWVGRVPKKHFLTEL
jgi:Tripartite tricarboxylate transporter family receptor